MPFITTAPFDARSFGLFKHSMMQQEDLPLHDSLDSRSFRDAFERHGIDFGNDPDAVYTPAITLWALISQVFFHGPQRSCKAAVARVASLWAVLGKRVCDTNTGAYCRARAKLTDPLIRDITKNIAADAQAQLDADEAADDPRPDSDNFAPEVVAAVQDRPAEGRILLADGFTVTAADTPENQAEYPQNPAQEPGLGFPILRCVSLISMATGMLVDLACGPYSGKGSGETALLRRLLGELRARDVLVADCYHCTYWLVAACRARGVGVVMKNHHLRDDRPAGARRLGPGERVVRWELPPRPGWMNEEEYEGQPESVEVRLVDVTVRRKGFRVRRLTVATTILDRGLYTRGWIASVYESRWLVELDIRSIKCSLGMDVIRAKSPAMVRAELWSCLLGYNLIRMKMLQSAAEYKRAPRSMSFTTTQQMLGANWLLAAVSEENEELARLGREVPVSERVGHRQGRVEPRANKRRPKLIALMTKPRAQMQDELINAA